LQGCNAFAKLASPLHGKFKRGFAAAGERLDALRFGQGVVRAAWAWTAENGIKRACHARDTPPLAMCDKESYSAHIIFVEAEMAATPPMPKARKARVLKVKLRTKPSGSAPLHASVMEEARRAGLFEGEKTEHVSFRASPALVEAAKRDAGIASTSELGVLALAMLARPDPVAAFFRRTEGRLGPDHDLEY